MIFYPHSTRLFPKERGANAYRVNGIASRCDWVVLSDSVPPVVHLHKNSDTEYPRHIFLSLRSPYEALTYFGEHILPTISTPFVLVSGSEDVTIPSQLDKRFRIYNDYEQQVIQRILNHSCLIHWFAENLDDASHPKMSPFPLGMLFKDGMPESGVAIPSLPPLASRPLQVLCAHRIRDDKQCDTRRQVTKLAKEHWSDFCTCLDYEIPEEEFNKLLQKFAFVLCVEGGGIDPSPKAWQAIMHGAVPIVLDSALKDAYAQLPVVFVPKWDESCLDLEKLEKWRCTFSAIHDDPEKRQAVIERLGIDYWWHKISILLPSQEKKMVAAASYDELMAHDADGFVQCVYSTLLGREPDPEGMKYYSARMACGNSKMSVLLQIANSYEAKNIGGIVIPEDICEAVNRNRIFSTLSVGRVCSGLSSLIKKWRF